MSDDFSNELKSLKTDWEDVGADARFPIQTDILPVYRRRALSILRRWHSETGEQYDETSERLALFGIWLRDVYRERLGPSSWRSYRYQCCQALPYVDFISIVSVPPATRKSDVVKTTSSNRRRHFKPDAVQRIVRHFSHSKSPYAQDVVELLQATIATGLRPSEWATARYLMHEGYLPYLKVKNAKKGTRSDIALSEFRAIPLSHLDAPAMRCIQNTITRFSFAEDVKKYQKLITNVFGRASALCFFGEASRPSLYSARHQFAADLKHSGISKEAIAYVMGHVSLDIQTHHYGREVNGLPSLIDESEIILLNAAL